MFLNKTWSKYSLRFSPKRDVGLRTILRAQRYHCSDGYFQLRSFSYYILHLPLKTTFSHILRGECSPAALLALSRSPGLENELEQLFRGLKSDGTTVWINRIVGHFGIKGTRTHMDTDHNSLMNSFTQEFGCIKVSLSHSLYLLFHAYLLFFTVLDTHTHTQTRNSSPVP